MPTGTSFSQLTMGNKSCKPKTALNAQNASSSLPHLTNPSVVVERRRRDPQLIDDFIACPAFLHAFQSAVKQLQVVFPSRYRRSFAAHALDAMRSRISSENRLLLVSGGRLCGMLARRLLCFNG
jgi:hypothetical protein